MPDTVGEMGTVAPTAYFKSTKYQRGESVLLGKVSAKTEYAWSTVPCAKNAGRSVR
jgi:hypothetical protein